MDNCGVTGSAWCWPRSTGFRCLSQWMSTESHSFIWYRWVTLLHTYIYDIICIIDFFILLFIKCHALCIVDRCILIKWIKDFIRLDCRDFKLMLNLKVCETIATIKTFHWFHNSHRRSNLLRNGALKSLFSSILNIVHINISYINTKFSAQDSPFLNLLCPIVQKYEFRHINILENTIFA